MPFTHGMKAIDTMSNTSNFRRSGSRETLCVMDGNEGKNEAYREEETHGPKNKAVKNLNCHDLCPKVQFLDKACEKHILVKRKNSSNFNSIIINRIGKFADATDNRIESFAKIDFFHKVTPSHSA